MNGCTHDKVGRWAGWSVIRNTLCQSPDDQFQDTFGYEGGLHLRSWLGHRDRRSGWLLATVVFQMALLASAQTSKNSTRGFVIVIEADGRIVDEIVNRGSPALLEEEVDNAVAELFGVFLHAWR